MEHFTKFVAIVRLNPIMRTKLPISMWGHAILHAASLIRIRSSANHKYSPIQLASGQEPNISHLRIFGCAMYVPIATSQRTKMGPQRRLGIYVGYETYYIIRYIEPLTCDLFTARFTDCHFDEAVFPELGGVKKNQEKDALGDEPVTKSHIPAANAPARVEIPNKQAGDNIAQESQKRLKRGRPIVYVPIAPLQQTKMGPQRRLGIYVGYETSSIIRYIEPLTCDLFTSCFADCHFDEAIFPKLGAVKKNQEKDVTWCEPLLLYLDPQKKQCETEVQKIVHLQEIANQLPDAFTYTKRVTESHIPPANSPARDKNPRERKGTEKNFVHDENVLDETQDIETSLEEEMHDINKKIKYVMSGDDDPEPKSVIDCQSRPDWDKWKDAMQAELNSLNKRKILPIIAEKVHQEKVQQEKLKAVKARLNFEETSHHSESGTPTRRRCLKERLGPRHDRNRSGSPKPRRGRSGSPKKKGSERKIVFKSYRDTERCHQSSRSRTTEPASERRYNKRAPSRRAEELSESEGNAGGHWKLKVKRPKLSIEDDLSQPWVCEETDHFTPRIRYFDFLKTRMPSHIKTYDGSEDPEDHLKKFQSAAKTERWKMPTWHYMINSTLTGNARVWFDDLPKETFDSYDDLKKAFLENYLQHKKCIKNPVEIHNIRQRDGESTEEFVRRYKLECRDVKGASELDEMMRITTAFLQREVAASNRKRKKSFLSWKQQEANQKQNFKKGGFRNQQRSERKQDGFALFTKTPKEIFALDKGKFKAPPPMTTPVEKRNANKFCEFRGEVGHNTDECMHLRKQIEEMLKAVKLSHLVKEIKQNNGKEQPKVTKKGETTGKDKTMVILMVQPWERGARQRITQSFSPNSEISFLPLREDEGTKGPMIIEAEIRGHCVHHEEHSASALMNFVVVRSPSPYNGIIGRSRVRKLQAVPSTVYGMLKIPVDGGVITLKSSRLVPLECAMVSGPERTISANETKVEERIKVAINP
ncbi:reverse transcriptase domain-containing protein [Tanacetum coccineum]